MNFKYLYLVLLSSVVSFAQLPEGFVYVKEVIPDLHVELRYNTDNNFVGQPVDGYNSNRLILTKQAAEALRLVQEELEDENLCLKVYDGYRPQQGVNHFMRWARDLNDTVNKTIFYPKIKKRTLFKAGYIATKSGHSRGSTIDLTLVDGSTGEVLDMGSPYDFFGEASWVNYPHISEKQKENRQKLQTVMLKHSFRNYSKEWWHFTLRWEPFPKTYFDFPVE
ncbi:M15 family metallopeptidase [Algibacter sp. TI.3.09]|uniref:M15 family metallopeptidase n=1 Tax=Algibacter sp. TI.3.09 TaxID=3121298 RepID=UPI00311E7D25